MATSQTRYYDLLQDYSNSTTGSDDSVTISPYWALAVVRLALPLSFSRAKMASSTTDVTQGGKVRAGTLIISSDCISMTVSGAKESHTKDLNAQLIQTDINYLTEILPGDWVLGWAVNDLTTFTDLLRRIKLGKPQQPCNNFKDGLKFLGRVQSVRKLMSLSPEGTKTSRYALQAIGFRELDTTFFYDNNLAEHDVLSNNIGNWLAKIGLHIEELFAFTLQNGQEDNVNLIIPTIIDLIVGSGASSNINPTGNKSLQATPNATSKEAPLAYLVPKQVSALLGKTSADPSKLSGLVSYADMIELTGGVQEFIPGVGPGNPSNVGDVFSPDIDQSISTSNRKRTPKPMLGAFLPQMPEFTNKPLWSILQQYLNPTVNELYTAMKVNEFGQIVPQIILRQIPFTTEAFSGDPLSSQIHFTKFLDVPRWKIPDVIVTDVNVGRSDATRCNFVHVYGQDSYVAKGVTITDQLVTNPPVRDDLDIYRSGLRPYMTTVACAVRNQVGNVPSKWIHLIADWMIGSHLTLNGTITCLGIHSPIAEGDNLEWDGVVYHIESVTHNCSISPEGAKNFTTTMSLTNGMRADGTVDKLNNNNQTPGGTNSGTSGSAAAQAHPIYPGLEPTDNTKYDPGISIDDSFNRTTPPVEPTALGSADVDQAGKFPDLAPPPSGPSTV